MTHAPWAALIAKEIREALRSRWLFGFVLVFTFTALAVSLIGTWSASIGGYSGFGRTTATLVNVVLLIVPLMGLIAGCQAFPTEREKGTLAVLLALPLKASWVFWSKVAGLALALFAALSLAFGLAGFALVLKGGFRDVTLYLVSFGATMLLALVSLALGLFLSSWSRRMAPALGIGLLAWLGLVFIGDLGLLGTSLAIRFSPGALLTTAWLNPLTLYRILAIDILGANLEMLGPAGQCAQDTLGTWLAPLLLAGLAAWMAALLAAAYWNYSRNPLRES